MMPTSIDPQPGDNQLECARCGAYFYFELTRCPSCGVNLYEPEDDLDEEYEAEASDGLIEKARHFLRRVLGKPYSAEEVFGNALDQAVLYNELLRKVGGDHTVVERLVSFEQEQMPEGTRRLWLQNAIQRWERDN
jgi:hypothetical protein